MNRVVFLIVATVGVACLGWAQGESAGCSQCYCAADNTCSTTGGCADTDIGDSRSVIFYPSCTGSYALKAVVTCSGGEVCKDCFPCVQLIDDVTGARYTCHTSCQAYDCDEICNIGTLNSSHRYTLYVALRKCFGSSCDQCGSCTARAYVFTPANQWGTACDEIPSCNP